MDERCNKGEKIQGLKAVTKNDKSLDFWSSQSQQIVSSSGVTMINHSHPQSYASNPPKFVNQGKFVVIYSLRLYIYIYINKS